MKRISTAILIMVFICTKAQTIDDVLRYSTENLQGTARFQGMSGAFGTLGGDFSALHANPASSAVFNHSQFTITSANYNSRNNAFFENNAQTTTNNALELNQAGAVFVFTSAESSWKKVALAFNFDMVQNFDNTVFAAGSTSQGIDNYFLNFAHGQKLKPLRLQPGESVAAAYLDIGADPNLGFAAQQAFLGLQSGIIAPDNANDDENTSYFSNALYNTVNQEFVQSTLGYNSKFTVNLAGQYLENLYLGASLNFHTVLYEQLTLLDEDGYDQNSPVQFTQFDNFLRTQGSGFSFSLGGIAKLNDNLRLGGSYQSPTWYELQDELSQRIDNVIDFSLVNLFDEYRIKTPAKLTGSAAIIFGKRGLLSIDYSYQDMAQAELRPTNDPNFSAENDFIASQLGVVHTFRLGGEFKIKALSLRGGYRFEESPYTDKTIISDLNGFSGGIGYDFGGSRLDLSFSRTEQDVTTFFFDSGIDSAALVDRTNTHIAMSYTLKF